MEVCKIVGPFERKLLLTNITSVQSSIIYSKLHSFGLRHFDFGIFRNSQWASMRFELNIIIILESENKFSLCLIQAHSNDQHGPKSAIEHLTTEQLLLQDNLSIKNLAVTRRYRLLVSQKRGIHNDKTIFSIL